MKSIISKTIKVITFSISALVFAGLFYSCIKRNSADKINSVKPTEEKPEIIPSKENVWVFVLAGQSNMAGRAKIETQDTIADKRILTLNNAGELILAKEPLHFYNDGNDGLGCGLAFAKTLIIELPDGISVLLIPTAVSASSISHWINDSLFRGVKLLTNFRKKTEAGMQYGTIKGILWHQGESDANTEGIKYYGERLGMLVSEFRKIAKNDYLPVLFGELGSFSKNSENFKKINEEIKKYSLSDTNTAVIKTDDLKDAGDGTHFNSESQREMGKRFAEGYRKFMRNIQE